MPYFQHKLQIKVRPFAGVETLTYKHFDEEVFKDIIPILRPVSDLDKEIEFNGEKFTPIEKLAELFLLPESVTYLLKETILSLSNLYFTKDLTDCLNFNTLINIHYQLCEWYFDHQDLIKKNLAIDINTLN